MEVTTHEPELCLWENKDSVTLITRSRYLERHLYLIKGKESPPVCNRIWCYEVAELLGLHRKRNRL